MMEGLGLAILGGRLADAEKVAIRAEAKGFDSVWTTDFFDRSAITTLAVMAQATERITIGSAIAYAVGRSPLVLSSEARDIDELSNGRLILGLGVGTKTMQRDWHSADFSHPAPRLEELIPLLRRWWEVDESGIDHEGRFYNLKFRPTLAINPPIRTDIPIYTAGVNPRMIQVAGSAGNGLVGHPIFSRRYVDEVARPAIAEGAERAGRDASATKIAGMVICSISEDGEKARNEAKAQIAFYSIVRTYRRVIELLDYEQEAEAARAAWERRDAQAMIDAIPDRVLNQIAVAGTPDEVEEQLEERFSGVFDHTLLYPASFGTDTGRLEENTEAILDVFGE